ncbi:hypothetical protein GC163_01030 [bacterium]|nr:hypothetical protein [bacterium]
MCCFTQPVKDVHMTQIFARPSGGGRQYLVYQMDYEAAEDLAMVLPLPVPSKTLEDDVKFINLKSYPDFFANMQTGFAINKLPVAAAAAGDAPLKVLDVGDFEASYVPTIEDFGRLDPRFRLPSDAWKSVPGYKSYGFAVFKLKSGKKEMHPMAFEFPRKNRLEIFFPTVHIHDGEYHETADFDHTLYLQVGNDQAAPMGEWRESEQPAGMFMRTSRTRGIVDSKTHVYSLMMFGDLPNKDTIIRS